MVVAETLIFSTDIRKKGTFRLKDVVKSVQVFFNEFKYNATNSYGEGAGTLGKKHEISWEGSRELNEYFKFSVKVFLLANDVREAVLAESNEKINIGDVNIKVEGYLITGNYRKKEQSLQPSFFEFLQNKYARWRITMKRQGQLIGEMEILQMKIKKALDLFSA